MPTPRKASVLACTWHGGGLSRCLSTHIWRGMGGSARGSAQACCITRGGTARGRPDPSFCPGAAAYICVAAFGLFFSSAGSRRRAWKGLVQGLSGLRAG